MTSDTHVRLSNLTRSFHEGEQLHAVLQSLDATFVRGEKVALRGRSGSGKSTLLNLISGIDVPDDGEVEIDGQLITAMSERDRTLFRRKHIGFVYQAFNLLPTLTVADNVRLVLELNARKGDTATKRISTLLDRVGLMDRAGSYPDLLSGGEQQRVAIARALAHGPSLVLADEPTGNLDDRTADEVLQMLDNMVSDAGGTMIVATHSARVAKTCDRVLELHDGRFAPRDST
jgi:putative ABC transport system ATP-binding protein